MLGTELGAVDPAVDVTNSHPLGADIPVLGGAQMSQHRGEKISDGECYGGNRRG